MKKQTFCKQRQLKSQKSLENITKNNSFNYQDNIYCQLKNKEKDEINNNLENNKINRNNIKKNIIDKKGKIGSLDYEIEPRNIFLIPDTYKINENNLKICEKELLPKEKNYFISEKNFQLLKETLNEKEEIIKELSYLIEKIKNENNKIIIDKKNINNNERIKTLEEENKKLGKINNELIFQIEKKNIYFNKIYQLLKFIFNQKYFEKNEIKNFIKEQDLEILFDNEVLNSDKENSLINILFTINKDMIINELENYKKKYNEIRKQLNYITNIKYSDKNNDYSNSKKIIIEYQKRMNELYLSNQNYIKENSFLKLICQNMFLDKKINDLVPNNNNLKNKLKEKNEYIKKIEKINSNLEKEINLIKNDKESLSNIVNNKNKDLINNKKEYEIKINQLSKNFNFIKSEKEKLEKNIIDNKQKENEEIKLLTNKNEFLYSELDKIKKSKSMFENLVIIKVENIFYNDKTNMDKYNSQKELINNYQNKNNNFNNMNFQTNDLDILMFLYNKSKQLEEYINNNNEIITIK